MAEYFMLQMMSEFRRAIDERALDPAKLKAIVGPAETAGKTVLRVNLYADDALIAASDKPCGAIDDLPLEFDDVYDALMTIGVASLSIAIKFDHHGQALNVRPYEF